MKTGLFLLIIVVFSHCTRKSVSVHEKQGWYGKMKVEERRKLFPFNEAAKVLLIAFPDYAYNGVYMLEDSITTPWGEKLPPIHYVKNKKVKMTEPVLQTFKAFYRPYSAYEIVELNQPQIDSLSHLAFNFRYRKTPQYTTSLGCDCYRPRNAILFFDKDDKLILDFEICFECGEYKYYPSGKSFYLIDNQCINSVLYKAFFKQNNIHYGVDSLKN